MEDDKQSSDRKRKNTSSSSSSFNYIGEYDPRLRLSLSIPQPDPQQVPLDLSPTLNPLSSSSSNNPNPNPNPSPNPSLTIRDNPPEPRTPTFINFIDPNQPQPKWVDKPVEYPPPRYPHSKLQPATIHSLKYLLENGIHTVSKEFKCPLCNQTYTVTYDIQSKFQELVDFIRREKDKSLSGRVAPENWSRPTLPGCEHCEFNCDIVRVPQRRLGGGGCEEIDWLFLLLGQSLGVCYKDQLDYFCRNNRIGPYRRSNTSKDNISKDELLYLVYFGLCRQLQPDEELFKAD